MTTPLPQNQLNPQKTSTNSQPGTQATVVVVTQQQQQQTLALVREKLKELGPGPYTTEQQKQRDSYIYYLNKGNMATNSQQGGPAGSQAANFHPNNATEASSTPIQQLSSTGQQPAGGAAAHSQNTQIMDKRALQELVKEVDPSEHLDEDVEDMLLQIADDFIENIINSSCQLAKHRKSNILEAKDVQFYLERNYNLWIPGFSTDELKPYKKSLATEAHKQRLQLIKKSTSKPGDGKTSNN